MKLLYFIHKYCSVLPMLAMLCMFLFLVLARIELGFVPTYGTQPDPSAFGYPFLELVGFILFMLSVPIAVLWPLASSCGVLFFGKRFKISYLSTLFFVCGVGSFFVMKYCFTGVFEWYMD